MRESTAVGFIYGVPYQSDAVELRDFFDKCVGGVQSVKLLASHAERGHSGVGFVTFSTEDDLLRALNRRRLHLHGREIGIEKAKSKPKPERV